jgi:hypothetical protein
VTNGPDEAAALGNNIRTIWYTALESQRNRLGETNLTYLDFAALLHEIGHAYQQNSEMHRRMEQIHHEMANFMLQNDSMQSSDFIHRRNRRDFVLVSPEYFRIGEQGLSPITKNPEGTRRPSTTLGFILTWAQYYIPLELFERQIQIAAEMEQDAHRYALHQFIRLRNDGINVEGDRSIEEIHSFMIAALNSYNRSYSLFANRPITAFTDGFELETLLAEINQE